MARKAKSLLLAGLLLTAMTGTASAQTSAFTDIGNSYAQKEINQLAADQILNGVGYLQFKPTGVMTREDFAIVLSKCLGLQTNSQAAASFTDLDNYARPYVGALVQAGLAHGYEANTYGGRDPVSRQDLAVFFMRAFGEENFGNQLSLTSTFADETNIATYAKPLVALAQRTGFMVGTDTGNGTYNLNPTAHADRQAVARLAYEFYENKKHYTDQFERITRVNTILTNMVQAENAVNNYEMVIDMTATGGDQPGSQHLTADFNKSPLALHEYGTYTSVDSAGKTNTVPIDAYIQGGTLYSKYGTDWVTQPYTSKTVSEPNDLTMSTIHTLAAYMTVTAEDNNTVTMSGTFGPREYAAGFPNVHVDPSQIKSVQYTIVMDKTNQLEKSFNTVIQLTSGEQDTVLINLQKYGQVGTIQVPDDVKAAAKPAGTAGQ